MPFAPAQGLVTVLPCEDLDATMAFFIDVLGFRIELISPADSPRMVVLSGHGGMLRLEQVTTAFDPGSLQLLCDASHPHLGADLTAPNGTRIEVRSIDPPIEIPAMVQSVVVSTLQGNARFGVGRAGMNYRDLVPDRQGGRFIASHIRIDDEGPVPDYVHFHKVRFQLIFVYRGWVKVVYEDQGEPFIMQAGDCVLQPPTIRHRVLEASAGLEVIEIGCPAEHDTIAEHVITLPTGRVLPDREYGGQLFVRHQAQAAPWTDFRYPGFVQQDLGIGWATRGLAGARVIRAESASSWPMARVPNEFLFAFMMDGSADLVVGQGAGRPIEAGDCFVIPADVPYGLASVSPDTRILEVSLPADLQPVPA